MNRKNTSLLILIFVALVIFMVTSCKPDNHKSLFKDTSVHQYELDSTSQYNDRDYRVYTLEGCEYILVGQSNFQWGSHKGNCKNPIHKKESNNE